MNTLLMILSILVTAAPFALVIVAAMDRACADLSLTESSNDQALPQGGAKKGNDE